MVDYRRVCGYALALVCSGLAFGLTMFVLLRWQIPRPQGFGVPMVAACLVGGVFGLLRREPAWLWALLASSAFCAYFGVVFIALLSTTDKDWFLPVVALATFGSGWLGVLAGRRLARARRPTRAAA